MTDAVSFHPLHGTTVALRGPNGWRGVLIMGPSGAGKSDLALRLIQRGGRLVADDYTCVFMSGGAAWATAPETIAERMEVRGVGVVSAPTWSLVRLGLVMELTTGPVERLPEPRSQRVAGVALPVFSLDAREPSAVEKITVLTQRL
jgi:serine kinase of HPr protein (carbohydrate metabolism regulator)